MKPLTVEELMPMRFDVRESGEISFTPYGAYCDAQHVAEALERALAQQKEALPEEPSERAKVAAYRAMTGRRDGAILGSDARRSKGWARMERMLKAAWAAGGDGQA